MAHAQKKDDDTLTKLRQEVKTLMPLAQPLGKPNPQDWRANNDEPWQSFEEYLTSRPIMVTPGRNKIYIQPIGDFTPGQKKILDKTQEFLGLFFNLPIQTQPAIALEKIPLTARRQHPALGIEQILSTYVMEEILIPHLPKDAASYLALTGTDLWPGEDWNFVFGQASVEDRVGVWSLYRNGEADKSEEEFKVCLLRTLKTASHEMGHMFSLLHCTKYSCGMNGSNYRAEADARPLTFCPQCLAKLCWACHEDLREHCRRVIKFCRQNGLDNAAEGYEQYLQTLASKIE